MAFLIETFWVPLALAGLIGVIIGWSTCSNASKPSWLSSWLPLALLAAVIGTYAATEYVVPGRHGLWLETGLMMFAAYLAGCCISCFIHSLMFGPPRAAERDPNAELYAKKMAGINSIAAERRAREAAEAATGTTEAGLGSGAAALAAGGAAVAGIAGAGAAKASAAAAAAGNVVSMAAAQEKAQVGKKPPLLTAPRNGKKDDLTLIWGVAEKLETQMNKMGIWHYDQIAAWTDQHVKWFEHELEGFKGRLERDRWIEQCEKLAKGWRPDNKAGKRT